MCGICGISYICVRVEVPINSPTENGGMAQTLTLFHEPPLITTTANLMPLLELKVESMQITKRRR